ncbi:unnamed protein product, partial [Rotaria magnacalcarata]
MADINRSEYWPPQSFSFWFTCYSKLHQSYRNNLIEMERTTNHTSLSSMEADKCTLRQARQQSYCQRNSTGTSYQHFWVTCALTIIIVASLVTPASCYGYEREYGHTHWKDHFRTKEGRELVSIESDAYVLYDRNMTIKDFGISRTTTTPPSQLDSPLVHELYDPLIHNGVVAASTSPILYHMGGVVLTGATKIYILYYGSWNANQKTIVETFLSNVGTTSWFNIEKTYYYQASSTSPKVYIKGPVSIGSRWVESYSAGTKLNSTIIANIICTRIKNVQVPNDPQGLYLLLSSSDVSEGSAQAGGTFCVNYCGYHLHFYIGNIAYFFGFIGNPQTCMNGCGPVNPTYSPNGDTGVDAMISVIAHELVESMSDPFGTAWFDATGNENADK